MFPLNPWLAVGVLIAMIAVGGGAYFYGFERGQEAERVEWQSRELGQVAAANKKLRELQEHTRQVEHRMQAALAAASAKYEEKRHANIDRKQRDAADARAGVIGLRYQPAASTGAGGGCPAEAALCPGCRDGGQATELPRAIAADLLDLANDADAVVEQLTACQAVVIEDRWGD